MDRKGAERKTRFESIADKHHHLNTLLKEMYVCVNGHSLLSFPTQPHHCILHIWSPKMVLNEKFLYNCSHRLSKFFQWPKGPLSLSCLQPSHLNPLRNSLSDPSSSYPPPCQSTQPLWPPYCSWNFLASGSLHHVVIGPECPSPTWFL